MKQKLKASLVISACIATMAFSNASFAQPVALQELNDLPKSSSVTTTNQQNVISNKHWVYQTLANITKKYGTIAGTNQNMFDGSKPLTRNEAAILLVNLMGKIEQDSIKLTDDEKNDLKYIKKELNEEIANLQKQIDELDTSVTALKGSISNLEKSDTKSIKYSYGKFLKINGDIQLQYTGTFHNNDNVPTNFSAPFTDLFISGELQPHVEYGLDVSPGSNTVTYDAFIKTDIIPHHNVYIGQTRVPIGFDGTRNPINKVTIDQSQIARNFSGRYDLGVKVAGDWKFAEYYLGAFNGNGLNKTDKNKGMALAAWGTVNVLHTLPKLGRLDIGGGFYSGKDTNDTANRYDSNIYSAIVDYKYKKFGLISEYAFNDGYLANNVKAQGLYVMPSYQLNKKIKLLARYDIFDPNKDFDHNSITEYTAGVNYQWTDNVLMRFAFITSDNNSQRISAMSQYSF